MRDNRTVNAREILFILSALILIVEGVNLGLMSHKLVQWYPVVRAFGLVMLVGGIVLLIWFVRRRTETEKRRGFSAATERGTHRRSEGSELSLLARFLSWLTGKLKRISFYTLPVIGALVIDAVIIYNLVRGYGLDLNGWDTVTIVFGVTLIAYNFIPSRFNYVKNFGVFFLGLLFFILIFPQVLGNLLTDDHTVAEVTKALLADPTAAFVRLFGIDATTSIQLMNGYYAAYVHFPFINGQAQALGIGESCSGIYTASLFIAAFVTYVLMEYHRFDRTVAILLSVGIAVTYLANIFRMGVIVIIGYYYGMDALLWTHANAGWLIFLGWMIPFWYLSMRWLRRPVQTTESRLNVDKR